MAFCCVSDEYLVDGLERDVLLVPVMAFGWGRRDEGAVLVSDL